MSTGWKTGRVYLTKGIRNINENRIYLIIMYFLLLQFLSIIYDKIKRANSC